MGGGRAGAGAVAGDRDRGYSPEQVIAVVVTGGEAPAFSQVERWFERADLVIGADSGLDTLGMYGVAVDLAVGDFDSVTGGSLLEDLAADRVVRYPVDKDETDTEIGVRTAFEQGATEVVLVGGGRGRLDHLLAIYEMFQRERCPRVWITDSEEVRLVDDEITVHGDPGETLSFLPVGAVECRMRSRGLKWPLDTVRWRRGDVGISNEFADREVRVTMVTGRLLLIRELSATPQEDES